MHTYVHFYNTQDMESALVSTDSWIDKKKKKMWYEHIISPRNKKNEILPFGTTWGDLQGITLSEMSDKDKYCMALSVHEF